MANRIKGITVEIGGDTTGLDKALKSVNTAIRSTQSALKDVNRLLKLDPSNTELLSQKQRLLKDAIAATKEKLDSLKVAQEQAKQQLENGELGQDKYDALQREIVETEEELRRLGFGEKASKSWIIPIYFEEKENINTSSMESELFLAILSSMAEGESASISENSKWSIKRRFQNGTFKLSYTPYGYDWDGENMIINPAQAAVVKRIFANILSGKSTNAIADELNAEKVPSKKNVNWTSSMIRQAFSPMKNIPVMSFFKRPIRMKTLIGTQIMVRLTST